MEKNLNNELLSFELRLAETAPNPKLKEMVYYNTEEKFYVYDSVYLSNNDIISTEVVDKQTQPKVKVILNDEGRKKFADFTGQHVGKNAAMIVDNNLMSAPKINAQITKGVLLIVGFFDHAEAQSIAKGILPKS
jgi:preprotein translocase subunit SecD